MLVDTSVWVDHLRTRSDSLADLLEAGEVVCHPFVIGELACGSLGSRAAILSLLASLPSLPKAEDDEVLEFIDRHHLMSSGLGLIDVHLLASCLLAGVPLWTHDAKLAAAASKLGLVAAR
jgi:predicted nucleic acid-binding protein